MLTIKEFTVVAIYTSTTHMVIYMQYKYKGMLNITFITYKSSSHHTCEDFLDFDEFLLGDVCTGLVSCFAYSNR